MICDLETKQFTEGHLPLLQIIEAQHFYVAHKTEYLSETCVVNLMGARFVAPYFIKSDPGGSSCSLCVCWARHTLRSLDIHLHLFSSAVPCLGVCMCVYACMCVCMCRISNFYMIVFVFHCLKWLLVIIRLTELKINTAVKASLHTSLYINFLFVFLLQNHLI